MHPTRRSLFAALCACALLAGCGNVKDNIGVIGCYYNRCIPATPTPTPTPTPSPSPTPLAT